MSQKPKVSIIKFTPLTLRKQYDDEDYGLLTWSVRNGYPRITVFTSNAHKSETFDYNTMITAPFDYANIEILLDYFEQVIDAPNDTVFKIECFNTKFVNNERTNDIELQSTVSIGKDKEGMIYLAVLAEGKRKVKFDLKGSRYHKYIVNGEVLTDDAAISKKVATGYLKVARKLLGYQLPIDNSLNKANAVTAGGKPKEVSKPAVDTSSLTEDDLF